MNFDIVISNPPYQNGLHEKFFQQLTDLVKEEIVEVGPLSWLINPKKKKDMCARINNYYSKIEEIDNRCFDARFNTALGITYLNKNKTPKLYYNNKEYNNTCEVSFISGDPILVSIYNKIKPYADKDNFRMHVYRMHENVLAWSKQPILKDTNSWLCRVPGITDSVYKNNYNAKSYAMYGHLYYSSQCGHYSIAKNLLNQCGKPTEYCIKLNSEIELINFWKYTHTRFFGMCYRLITGGNNIAKTNMSSMIPWLDFTKEWTDDELFSYFGITEEEKQHVIDIQPFLYENWVDDTIPKTHQNAV